MRWEGAQTPHLTPHALFTPPCIPDDQVLTSAFPGVHITEDVAALERLPEVGDRTGRHGRGRWVWVGSGPRALFLRFPGQVCRDGQEAWPAPRPRSRQDPIITRPCVHWAHESLPAFTPHPCTHPRRAHQETELLAAGFPCIDVSRAGLRRGLEGKSTGLVRHVFRLLRVAARARRPVPWVLLENVSETVLGGCGGLL